MGEGEREGRREKQVICGPELIFSCSLIEGEEWGFLGPNKSNKVENEVLKSSHITEFIYFLLDKVILQKEVEFQRISLSSFLNWKETGPNPSLVYSLKIFKWSITHPFSKQNANKLYWYSDLKWPYLFFALSKFCWSNVPKRQRRDSVIQFPILGPSSLSWWVKCYQ